MDPDGLGARQQELHADIEVIETYAEQFPDSWVGVRFQWPPW